MSKTALDEILLGVYNRGYVDGKPMAMYDKPAQISRADAKQAILHWVADEVIGETSESSNGVSVINVGALLNNLKNEQRKILAQHGYKGAPCK